MRGDTIAVRGEVSVLKPEELEKRTGSEPSGELRRRRGRPALLAEGVQLIQHLLPLAPAASAARVAARPQAFVGRVTAVSGRVTARGVAGLLLDQRLPVLLPRDASAPPVGTLLTVTGPVRRLDSDQLSGGDFRERLFGRFVSRPVVIAETVAIGA